MRSGGTTAVGVTGSHRGAAGTAMSVSGPVVLLHIYGAAARRVPGLLARSVAGAAALRRHDGARFTRLLGTGSARSFALRDADLRHWALLSVWDDAVAAARADHSDLHRRWTDVADERLRVTMTPISATGRWAGQRPFAPDRCADGPTTGARAATDGPVAALTRARLRPLRARAFRRAVPAVAADLAGRPGLRLALGIGETPVLHQGTFSVWTSTRALTDFSHSPAHREVVRRTPEVGWYAEETFARFAVLGLEGTYLGRTP